MGTEATEPDPWIQSLRALGVPSVSSVSLLPMSLQLALDTLALKPVPRFARTEYSLEYHQAVPPPAPMSAQNSCVRASHASSVSTDATVAPSSSCP